MEKREVGRKSSRTVPVIIENHENATKKTKLMVPSNYTAGQLVNILRSRMHLRPYHPVYLFLKSKQSPVLMSKSIGHLHHKHRDEKGLLRLIHAEQASFGFRGNIRAIRFRQKWIENLYNTSGHTGGFSFPPANFPAEPSTSTNFGAPLDIDNLYDSDSIEEIPVDDDFNNDYLNNPFIEMEDPVYITDMSSWQSFNNSQLSTMSNHSQSSALTNSSQSSVSTDWIDSLTDPWLPSTNANSGMANDFTLPNQGNILDQALHNMELEIDMAEHFQHAASVLGFNISANVQPPNPQTPQFHLALYDSDSEFYESDDMQE